MTKWKKEVKKEVMSGWKWSEDEKGSENKNIFKLAILTQLYISYIFKVYQVYMIKVFH